MKKFIVLSTFWLSHWLYAEELATDAATAELPVTEMPVQVGKHVASNLDAMSMIISLLMVLAVIFVSAMVLKRFQGVRQSINGMQIVTSLHLGAKEKLVVVQAGEQQLLLGVTPQQISLLKTLDKPLQANAEVTNDFAKSFANILKQKSTKAHDKQP
ncbi:flagellar protein FliO/FliZ [Colwellia chukchiensis]|uniref:Flagellar protein n=1 Tax=Colwellia chukchiensis TaxID=641665 RepID=A0A1H7HER3_9GAMM|nr:flagellar biosynthetic protein FliO [Colwellia chukchiensis]SEK48724.1 flagellar protein FliO/FliZ [Colwellia chukchiensis]